MSLIKRRPYSPFSFIDGFFNHSFPNFLDTELESNYPANIKEEDNNFTIELAVPGVKKDDFKISVDNQILSISLKDKKENERKDETNNYTHKEFNYQYLNRQFTLSKNVDLDNIKAEYIDGILSLSLPKQDLVDTKKYVEVN